VNQTRYPLRVNIGFLLNQPLGSWRDIHFEFPTLRLSEDLPLTDFAGVVRFNRAVQGLLAEADFSATLTLQCVRCLTDYPQRLHSQFQELFAFRRDQVTESGLMVPEDGNVDFAPLAIEYLLIEIPIKPLCKPNCRGLCVECGADLNVAACEHHAADAASG